MIPKFLFFIFIPYILVSQTIKTVQIKPIGIQKNTTIVPLGTVLEVSFDDLDADAKDYQYKIEHCTENWQPSRLPANQYITGFSQNTILNVQHSFNTLQNYTHYRFTIPNNNTVITKSGNYLLSILNEDNQVVCTRRFVLYEKISTVNIQVLRSRNTKTANTQQTIHFTVNYPTLQINNPNQEIKVVILQNFNWNTTIVDLQPQFIKPHQLTYTYTNKTNFFGGNEFLNFDSKNIRNNSIHIRKIEQKDIIHNYIHTQIPRATKLYTYAPDINGQFVIRTLNANNPDTEADYPMMHFSLATTPYPNKDIYVYGGFNNFELNNENKMYYDTEAQVYKTAFPLKQGFYNYCFATQDKNGNISFTDIDGSFFQTENEYTIIVYYKPFGALYTQVIGVGNSYFNQNK